MTQAYIPKAFGSRSSTNTHLHLAYPTSILINPVKTKQGLGITFRSGFGLRFEGSWTKIPSVYCRLLWCRMKFHQVKVLWRDIYNLYYVSDANF